MGPQQVVSAALVSKAKAIASERALSQYLYFGGLGSRKGWY
jgi:hypothetical protein